MKKVGITGATGFLGGHFLRQFLISSHDVRVRCLARHSPTDITHPDLEWLVGDLMNEADCAEFVEGLDSVVHFAQSNSPAISDRHWSSDLLANISPALNLLDTLRRRSGSKCHLVFASSGGAVYGRQPLKRASFNEYDECLPLNPYGIQKLALEHYLRTACEQGWLRATVLRISNAYGDLMSVDRRQGLIGVALSRVLAGQPVKVFGPLDTVRDYIHVNDIVRAFKLAVDDWDSDHAFRIFNISAGIGHSVADVLAMISNIAQKSILTEDSDFGYAAISLLPWVVLDNRKAFRELGWEPEIDLQEGIRRLVEKSTSQH
jgi:UDP-glucose 4-epimerase